jgi:hypothetical protein
MNKLLRLGQGYHIRFSFFLQEKFYVDIAKNYSLFSLFSFIFPISPLFLPKEW